ncbi:uncharacterized protein LOC135219394 [Macrobrachium nipponense]|uniref:uncharacterized protein LOC135219394 n=1 Tax=Macrobrachium nipponense TaxID=159736 RepID=UPI0030C89453
MFLFKLFLVSFIGYVNARPGGFQASGHIKVVAPKISVAPVATSVTYSNPAPVKVVAPPPVVAAPVSTITTARFHYDPQLFTRKAQRVAGAITDIVNVVGNLVVNSLRDLPPPPKITTTHVQQPVAAVKTVTKQVTW